MNGAAWFAFGISAVIAGAIIVWSLLVMLDVLPESDDYKMNTSDGMYAVVAFFLAGLAAILVGG